MYYIIIIIVSVLLFIACAKIHKIYPGPELSKDKIAILYDMPYKYGIVGVRDSTRNTYHTIADRIDDQDACYLLPGNYEIVINIYRIRGTQNFYFYTVYYTKDYVNLKAEAGHKYKVKFREESIPGRHH